MGGINRAYIGTSSGLFRPRYTDTLPRNALQRLMANALEVMTARHYEALTYRRGGWEHWCFRLQVSPGSSQLERDLRSRLVCLACIAAMNPPAWAICPSCTLLFRKIASEARSASRFLRAAAASTFRALDFAMPVAARAIHGDDCERYFRSASVAAGTANHSATMTSRHLTAISTAPRIPLVTSDRL